MTKAQSATRPRGHRVLYWTEIFLPYTGGTEVLSANLLAGLRRRGVEFAVVTSHADRDLPDEDDHDGIPVHRFPFLAAATGRDPAAVLRIRRRVEALKRDFAPDLVHVNAAGPSLLFHLQTADRDPTPWVFTPHAPLTDQSTGEDTILGKAFRTADWVACLSEAQMESIRRLAQETSDRSSVIYCGLPPPPLAPGPPPAEPRIVCVGRHVPDKGFDLGLAAFALLADRYAGMRLAMVGDGPVRPELERQAVELGIADRVDFLGRVPSVPPHMNAATIVLMPSRWEETFGLVALEAALMARPIVATRVGALPEVVQDGETGLIVDREDPAALAGAMAALLDAPETAARMGRAGRERALDRFSLEGCVAGYEALYGKLIGRTSARTSSAPAPRDTPPSSCSP